MLILPPADVPSIEKTAIDHYSYNWPYRDVSSGKVTRTQAIALGLGSIFNHSEKQNVGFTRDFGREVIEYVTLRDVGRGEELCINYGPRLWFEDAERERGGDGERDDGGDEDGGEGAERDVEFLMRIELD